MKTIAIIEDEKLLGNELKRRFEREGWRVTHSPRIEDARRLFIELGFAPAIVLSDMNLPDGNGLDFLEEARAHNVQSEWIFLSGYGTRKDIERAADLGALDFLAKPLDFHKLDLTIATATRGAQARQRIDDTTRQAVERFSPESFIGPSDAAAQVRNMLVQLGKVPITSILIGGETGTGKGLVAKILHYSGLRKDGPFIDLNCAAIPKDMLESELFGHESGAFTGAKGRHRGLMEQADGGTLFLDEIGEMDIGLQSKLLTSIEEQSFRRVGGEEKISVDIQLVAASNRDLRAASARGDFRLDLYHRISVFEMALPALRNRNEDIAPIVANLIGEFNARSGKQVQTVPERVMAILQSYGWPGNVRELRNVIERSVMLANGAELPGEWLGISPSPLTPVTQAPAMTGAGAGAGATTSTDTSPITHALANHTETASGQMGDAARSPVEHAITLPLDGSVSLEEMEEKIIRKALALNGYNVMATVRALGTTRETLRYRIRKYGLEDLLGQTG
ncbi:sigma-54-dependent transcriptional regulator [Thalassospira marina]|nr:sigma-54 dependent transcriptional regulator [Thalassospira marina]